MSALSSGPTWASPGLFGLCLVILAQSQFASAAPVYENQQTEIDSYYGDSSGCYYNYEHYSEGDRIITNEPCLNCTCHNRMLMCYLRVCPFTKPIGQDCKVEKREDQCCPVITCPEVPVELLTSTTTTSLDDITDIGHPDTYGCSIENRFYTDGAQVPSNPRKPCELCYCIRNMTACVMQECTLHVEGCRPIYQKGVCCPVRYDCDHDKDDHLLLDETTTTVRPTPGFMLTTTVAPGVTLDCSHSNNIYADGALITTEKPCEHCYCMKGDIVCAVQECGTPLENEGKNCTALPPRDNQCCPDTYICDNATDVFSTAQPGLDLTTLDISIDAEDEKQVFTTERVVEAETTKSSILSEIDKDIGLSTESEIVERTTAQIHTATDSEKEQIDQQEQEKPSIVFPLEAAAATEKVVRKDESTTEHTVIGDITNRIPSIRDEDLISSTLTDVISTDDHDVLTTSVPISTDKEITSLDHLEGSGLDAGSQVTESSEVILPFTSGAVTATDSVQETSGPLDGTEKPVESTHISSDDTQNKVEVTEKPAEKPGDGSVPGSPVQAVEEEHEDEGTQKPVVDEVTQTPEVQPSEVDRTQKPVEVATKPVKGDEQQSEGDATPKPSEVTEESVKGDDQESEHELTQKPVDLTEKPAVITEKPVEVTEKLVDGDEELSEGSATQKPGQVTESPVEVTEKTVEHAEYESEHDSTQKPVEEVTERPVEAEMQHEDEGTQKPVEISEIPVEADEQQSEVNATHKPLEGVEQQSEDDTTLTPAKVTVEPVEVTEKSVQITEKPVEDGEQQIEVDVTHRPVEPAEQQYEDEVTQKTVETTEKTVEGDEQLSEADATMKPVKGGEYEDAVTQKPVEVTEKSVESADQQSLDKATQKPVEALEQEHEYEDTLKPIENVVQQHENEATQSPVEVQPSEVETTQKTVEVTAQPVTGDGQQEDDTATPKPVVVTEKIDEGDEQHTAITEKPDESDEQQSERVTTPEAVKVTEKPIVSDEQPHEEGGTQKPVEITKKPVKGEEQQSEDDSTQEPAIQVTEKIVEGDTQPSEGESTQEPAIAAEDDSTQKPLAVTEIAVEGGQLPSEGEATEKLIEVTEKPTEDDDQQHEDYSTKTPVEGIYKPLAITVKPVEDAEQQSDDVTTQKSDEVTDELGEAVVQSEDDATPQPNEITGKPFESDEQQHIATQKPVSVTEIPIDDGASKITEETLTDVQKPIDQDSDLGQNENELQLPSETPLQLEQQTTTQEPIKSEIVTLRPIVEEVESVTAAEDKQTVTDIAAVTENAESQSESDTSTADADSSEEDVKVTQSPVEIETDKSVDDSGVTDIIPTRESGSSVYTTEGDQTVQTDAESTTVKSEKPYVTDRPMQTSVGTETPAVNIPDESSTDSEITVESTESSQAPADLNVPDKISTEVSEVEESSVTILSSQIPTSSVSSIYTVESSDELDKTTTIVPLSTEIPVKDISAEPEKIADSDTTEKIESDITSPSSLEPEKPVSVETDSHEHVPVVSEEKDSTETQTLPSTSPIPESDLKPGVEAEHSTTVTPIDQEELSSTTPVKEKLEEAVTIQESVESTSEILEQGDLMTTQKPIEPKPENGITESPVLQELPKITSEQPEEDHTKDSVEIDLTTAGRPTVAPVESDVTPEVAEQEIYIPVGLSEDKTDDEAVQEHIVPPVGIIPGEGGCLVDGTSYNNNQSIPPVNKCQKTCKCVDSIIRCESVNCLPPLPGMRNCQPVYHGLDNCCPTYMCENEESGILESDNHMSESYPESIKPTEAISTEEEPTKTPEPEIGVIALTELPVSEKAPNSGGQATILPEVSEEYKPTGQTNVDLTEVDSSTEAGSQRPLTVTDGLITEREPVETVKPELAITIIGVSQDEQTTTPSVVEPIKTEQDEAVKTETTAAVVETQPESQTESIESHDDDSTSIAVPVTESSLNAVYDSEKLTTAEPSSGSTIQPDEHTDEVGISEAEPKPVDQTQNELATTIISDSHYETSTLRQDVPEPVTPEQVKPSVEATQSTDASVAEITPAAEVPSVTVGSEFTVVLPDATEPSTSERGLESTVLPIEPVAGEMKPDIPVKSVAESIKPADSEESVDLTESSVSEDNASVEPNEQTTEKESTHVAESDELAHTPVISGQGEAFAPVTSPSEILEADQTPALTEAPTTILPQESESKKPSGVKSEDKPLLGSQQEPIAQTDDERKEIAKPQPTDESQPEPEEPTPTDVSSQPEFTTTLSSESVGSQATITPFTPEQDKTNKDEFTNIPVLETEEPVVQSIENVSVSVHDQDIPVTEVPVTEETIKEENPILNENDIGSKPVTETSPDSATTDLTVPAGEVANEAIVTPISSESTSVEEDQPIEHLSLQTTTSPIQSESDIHTTPSQVLGSEPTKISSPVTEIDVTETIKIEEHPIVDEIEPSTPLPTEPVVESDEEKPIVPEIIKPIDESVPAEVSATTGTTDESITLSPEYAASKPSEGESLQTTLVPSIDSNLVTVIPTKEKHDEESQSSAIPVAVTQATDTAIVEETEKPDSEQTLPIEPVVVEDEHKEPIDTDIQPELSSTIGDESTQTSIQLTPSVPVEGQPDEDIVIPTSSTSVITVKPEFESTTVLSQDVTEESSSSLPDVAEESKKPIDEDVGSTTYTPMEESDNKIQVDDIIDKVTPIEAAEVDESTEKMTAIEKQTAVPESEDEITVLPGISEVPILSAEDDESTVKVTASQKPTDVTVAEEITSVAPGISVQPTLSADTNKSTENIVPAEKPTEILISGDQTTITPVIAEIPTESSDDDESVNQIASEKPTEVAVSEDQTTVVSEVKAPEEVYKYPVTASEKPIEAPVVDLLTTTAPEIDDARKPVTPETVDVEVPSEEPLIPVIPVEGAIPSVSTVSQVDELELPTVTESDKQSTEILPETDSTSTEKSNKTDAPLYGSVPTFGSEVTSDESNIYGGTASSTEKTSAQSTITERPSDTDTTQQTDLSPAAPSESDMEGSTSSTPISDVEEPVVWVDDTHIPIQTTTISGEGLSQPESEQEIEYKPVEAETSKPDTTQIVETERPSKTDAPAIQFEDETQTEHGVTSQVTEQDVTSQVTEQKIDHIPVEAEISKPDTTEIVETERPSKTDAPVVQLVDETQTEHGVTSHITEQGLTSQVPEQDVTSQVTEQSVSSQVTKQDVTSQGVTSAPIESISEVVELEKPTVPALLSEEVSEKVTSQVPTEADNDEQTSGTAAPATDLITSSKPDSLNLSTDEKEVTSLAIEPTESSATVENEVVTETKLPEGYVKPIEGDIVSGTKLPEDSSAVTQEAVAATGAPIDEHTVERDQTESSKSDGESVTEKLVEESPDSQVTEDVSVHQEIVTEEAVAIESDVASKEPPASDDTTSTTLAPSSIFDEHDEQAQVAFDDSKLPVDAVQNATSDSIPTSMPSSPEPAHEYHEEDNQYSESPIGSKPTSTPATFDGAFPQAGYGQPGEEDYEEDEQAAFGPGTCRYGGKVYVSAQQIPREDPCDFCFCFRSDIICLQQSCPPPIPGCHEEPIQGFCCPRYECPVSMATMVNLTTTTTTTTTTVPPHFMSHAYKGAAARRGCQIQGQAYQVGEVVRSASGPCLHCTCGGDGQMKCDPKVCSPEPMLRQMIAAAASSRRR